MDVSKGVCISMSIVRDQILEILYECIDELNEQLAPEQQLRKAPQTGLFGDSGMLDSLGFVNLVALVEDRCERRFRVALSLTEDATNQGGADPFETVGELADFIRQLLIDKKALER
jgi:acyl carrier protein